MTATSYALRFIACAILLAADLRVGVQSLRAASAATSTVIPGIGLLHLGDTLPNASNQSSYSTLIVSQDDASAAAALPGRSLVYFSGPDVNTQWNAGVTYIQASTNGWLLRDASGNLLVNQGYPNNYVGEPAVWRSSIQARPYRSRSSSGGRISLRPARVSPP